MSRFTESLEVGERDDDSPSHYLVRIVTTRRDYVGWIASIELGYVSLTEMVDRRGTEADYMTHINPDHIVSWAYTDMDEVTKL